MNIIDLISAVLITGTDFFSLGDRMLASSAGSAGLLDELLQINWQEVEHCNRGIDRCFDCELRSHT